MCVVVCLCAMQWTKVLFWTLEAFNFTSFQSLTYHECDSKWSSNCLQTDFFQKWSRTGKNGVFEGFWGDSKWTLIVFKLIIVKKESISYKIKRAYLPWRWLKLIFELSLNLSLGLFIEKAIFSVKWSKMIGNSLKTLKNPSFRKWALFWDQIWLKIDPKHRESGTIEKGAQNWGGFYRISGKKGQKLSKNTKIIAKSQFSKMTAPKGLKVAKNRPKIA